MYRLFQRLWIWRWARTLLALTRGVRLHPTASLIGLSRCFTLTHGVKIGARSIFDIARSGNLILGEDVWVSSDVEMQTATEIYVSRGTTIQRRCTINGSTRIGAECIFAPNVFVSSGTHPFRVFPALSIREQERRIAKSLDQGHDSIDRPVWIQADCWLGTNVVVCPGVTIGKGSVVGANSVVKCDVLPYSVIAGSPARLISTRLVWSPPAMLDAADEEQEIYVLDGIRTKCGDGLFGFLPDQKSACFVAALSSKQPVSGVRIHYRSVADLKIEVAGREFTIIKGSGTIDTPLEYCASQEYLRLALRSLSPNSHGMLFISKVCVLESPIGDQ